MSKARSLTRTFYERPSTEVAPDLLNKVLVHGGRAARIVEVEAYAGADDPGSHAFRGPTPRTLVMFGPPGHLYVYFTYGMHWCANAVCGAEGQAGAVLLRAAVPILGLDEMRAARPKARTDRDLCRGPARLCQALGITGANNGEDLVAPVGRVELTAPNGDLDPEAPGGGVRIVDQGTPPPAEPAVSPRIGLSAGVELPWRWFVPGEQHLSRPG